MSSTYSGTATPVDSISRASSIVDEGSTPHTLYASDSAVESFQSKLYLDGVAIYPYEEATAPRTLVDILQATISSHPEALAIDNGTSRLTYAELSHAIDLKVRSLRDAGVVTGDRVGVRITSGTLDLYVSILAVLFAGAAYVPVDVDDPDARAELVWSEAAVAAVATDEGIKATERHQTCERSHSTILPTVQDDAWIIFTSGSTGKPKGVAVTHRSAAALVDAETRLFLPDAPLCPGDRVLAGLSVAFDASCEEMWLAWAHGACLVPAARSLVKAGADLGIFLAEQRITVVSTVPTLAAMWPAEALKNIRLLILGGEACPPQLADRLANSVDAVWNTYGPTEATVISCGAQIKPNQPVAIGLPIAGWRLAVVGSDGYAVPWGQEGELVIGGVGMARYLDLEKDKAKFKSVPEFAGERGYYSGDLVRAEREGLFFVGRNDEQIKFGGRRIELGEIDAALLKLPGVSGAACALQKTEMGTQVLVGYVVRSCEPETKDRDLLRSMLPPSLIPVVVAVDNIPVRTSGKVDRKALPWPLPESLMGSSEPIKGTMGQLSDQWRRVLGVAPSAESNFFDLGGTSLGAAQLVSQLRKLCPSMAVADVYEHPTLETMAARLDELAGDRQETRQVKPVPWWTFLFQLPIMFLLLLFQGFGGVAILLMTKKFAHLVLRKDSWPSQHEVPWAAAAVLYFLFVTTLGRMVVTVVFVRPLTLGLSPGSYPRGGFTHIRLWAVERIVAVSRINNIAGTSWVRLYARLLGCRVEGRVQLYALPPVTGLGTFSRGCVVEPEADIAGWWLDGDELHIGSVTIGEGARVGTRSMLMPGTVVRPLTDVKPGTCAQGTIDPPEDVTQPNDPTELTREPILTALRHTLTLFVLDALPVFTVLPTFALAAAVENDWNNLRGLYLAFLKMALPGVVVGLLLYMVAVTILIRLASLAISPGMHSWHSRAAWAAWLTRLLVLEARTILFPIYASLFTPVWLRILGARIGHNVEISTVVPIPCLLSVEDNAFLADDVLVSPYELQSGGIRLGMTTIGKKTFIGNTGLVKAGSNLPERVLVGVYGTAPENAALSPGSSWLGSPPISLPRQAETCTDSKRTFDPPTRLKIARGLVESWRLLPLLILGMLTTLTGLGNLYMLVNHGIGWAILAGAGFIAGSTLIAATLTTIAKWIITPVVRAGQQSPLWSNFVWRNEVADTFVQSLALPFVAGFYGTPILCLWMRSMGAKIGRGVWMESHLLPEAELVTIGDGATINRGCVLQTHLFHDRLLRLDRVCLQPGATLGPSAIALPGTDTGAGVTVGPKSLVMRGEHLPAGTRWLGNPVRPWAKELREMSSRKVSAPSTVDSLDSGVSEKQVAQQQYTVDLEKQDI
jgi:non-ribosomal peptide synthetase-like protein